MASALGVTSNSDFFSALKEMTPFQSDSKALGGSKKIVKDVVKKEVSKPLNDLSSFFAGIDRSLINLVVFAKKSFGLQEKEQKRENKKDIGPMPGSNMIRTGKETLVDTDGDGKGDKKPILSTLKQSFDNVDFGDKMTALLFAGGLALFLKYKEAIISALTPLVEIVMGIVDIIGVEGTLMTLFGIIVGIKLFPVISAATDVVTYLTKNFLPSFKTLKDSFKSMKKFINTTLPKQLKNAYSGTKGGFTKALKLLSRAFLAMRVFMTATLVPALMGMVTSMMTVLAPILVPLGVIILIAAGIAAVLFSLKSGFETFKKSLDDGDSMLVAIGKGIADFAITLLTLPITLIKKLVGFIAGLFGFDGIKEKLDKFSFKDLIKNAFFGFIGSFVKVIKAIAKGAAAALSAIAPGGKTPQAEFSRVYNEIMQGGAGQVKVEKTDLEKTDTDSEPELTENEVAKSIKEKEDAETLRAPLKILKKIFVGDRFIPGTEAYERAQKFEKDQELKRLPAKLEAMSPVDYNKYQADNNMNRNAAYNEITSIDAKRIDLSTNVKHETYLSGDLAADNNEAFQRLINAFGGRYGNSF